MSSSVVIFHRLAAREFRLARSWYAQRSERAALRFIEAIEVALQQIAADPERWPLYDHNTRWVKIRKYPYLVFYRSTAEGTVIILAVAHAGRRPGYWRRRMAAE
jgi:plasmid stabilization system protein ParE